MSLPEPTTAAPDGRSIEAAHPEPESGVLPPPGTASQSERLVETAHPVLADVANLRAPAKFSPAGLIAVRESIRTVAEGDADAANRAQSLVGALVQKHGGSHAAAAAQRWTFTVDERSVGEWTEWDYEAGGARSSAGSAEPRTEYAAFAFDFEFDLR